MLGNTRTKLSGGMLARLLVMFGIALATTLCMQLCLSRGFATDASTIDKDKEQATLSVVSVDGEGAEAKPVAGMEFAAYEVARIGENGGYKVLEPFASVTANYDSDMTVSDMKKLAKSLEEIASNHEPNAKAITNSDGVAELGKLENGVYLVVQTNAQGDAVAYTTSDPYLVNVPQFESDGKVTYSVTAYPKFKKLPPTTPDETPAWEEKKPVTANVTTSSTASRSAVPKTDDGTSWITALGLVFVGLTLIVAAAKVRESSL